MRDASASSLFNSPLPISLFDDREEILAISQSWLEQSGYLREELRRLEDWTIRAFGERSGEVLEQIRRIAALMPAAGAHCNITDICLAGTIGIRNPRTFG
jgi:PAS domain-containing protein